MDCDLVESVDINYSRIYQGTLLSPVCSHGKLQAIQNKFCAHRWISFFNSFSFIF